MFSRPNALWMYQLICWLAVLALLAHIAFCDWVLLKPTDVGGTLMGGMNGLLFNAGWLVATSGLLLTLLLRLPGSIYACIGAGLLTLGIGAWSLINYPDDADQLIYSVSPGEIGSGMLTGAIFLTLGLFLRSRFKTTGRQSRSALVAKSVVASLIAILFIGAPIRIAWQVSLPNCAFNKQGQQLTICLGDDEDERAIVD